MYNKKLIFRLDEEIEARLKLRSAELGISYAEYIRELISKELLNNNLEGIIKLIQISKYTLTTIKENLFWAFFYNALMIPLAIGIFKPFGISITPMFASIAMVFSSLTVILNSLRLQNKKIRI